MMSEVYKIKVSFAIDNELLRLAIRQILGAWEEVELQDETSDAGELLHALAMKPAQVILVKRSAIKSDFLKYMALLTDSAKVLLMINHETEFPEVSPSGADGYLLPETAIAMFPVAIKAVYEGAGWIDPRIAKFLLQGAGKTHIAPSTTPSNDESGMPDILTAKEKEVMKYLLEGMSNQNIAVELGLSIETVRVHVKHILKKLGVKDRVEAALRVSGQFKRPVEW